MAAREVILPTTRTKWQLRLQFILALLFLTMGVLYLVFKDNVWMSLAYTGLGAGYSISGLTLLRRRVTLDATGLQVVNTLSSIHVPWSDLASIRGNARGWSEYLVLERHNGTAVKVPPRIALPEETLARWRPGPTSPR